MMGVMIENPLDWAKRVSEAGSLMQIVEKINWIGDYELSGTTGGGRNPQFCDGR